MKPATNTMTSQAVLERELLGLRARTLEIAAGLDRIDRAEGELFDAADREKITAAIEILLRSSDDRAEQIQLLFSRPYSTNWRKEMMDS